MKKSKKIQALVLLVAIISLLALVACAPQTADPNSGDTSSDTSEDFSVASMMAVHADGVIDPEMEYTKKDCLSCHPRDAINVANVDYGGEVGVNPHAAHTESYECTVCHSITGTSSMKCNACHEYQLPEGWENPPKESSSPSSSSPSNSSS